MALEVCLICVFQAAKQLAKEDPPIHLAAVDATEAPDLAKQFDVTGYPTLKLMRKGKALKYDGPRDAEGEWLRLGE